MTPAMTKIEQIAKAIYERRNGARCHPWSKQPKSHQEPYLMDAEAALEAMREPTEVMLGAMNETTIEAWDGDAFWPAKDDCKSLFNAAIDAALSEDKEQG